MAWPGNWPTPPEVDTEIKSELAKLNRKSAAYGATRLQELTVVLQFQAYSPIHQKVAEIAASDSACVYELCGRVSGFAAEYAKAGLDTMPPAVADLFWSMVQFASAWMRVRGFIDANGKLTHE